MRQILLHRISKMPIKLGMVRASYSHVSNLAQKGVSLYFYICMHMYTGMFCKNYKIALCLAGEVITIP